MQKQGMGNLCSKSNLNPNETRGIVEIIYSSTTGTSKNASQKLQSILEAQQYIAPITDIGDYDYEDFISFKGTVLFLLSTYGNGDSPDDGENFLKWIESLKPENQFEGLEYAILAFGNSNFERHCGFGLRTEKVLKECGAKEICLLTKCDASAKDRNFEARFPNWVKELVQKLNETHPLRPKGQLTANNACFATIEDRPGFEWEQNIPEAKVSKEFSNYWSMPKCKVIHIKELRQQCVQGRSTLWIRIETNKDMNITPACNINVFPLNAPWSEEKDEKIIEFSEVKGKVPFPAMLLKDLRRIIDFKQKASDKQVKIAVMMSSVDEAKKQQVQNKSKEKDGISVRELINELKPDYSFYANLNLNTVRVYTLSSWQPEQKYIDLVVSIVPNGLTSNYFQTNPEYLRIKPIPSSFYIPEGRPIVMIANGSGIAPFRSIAEYFARQPAEKRNFLRLYYGIQNEDVDFYFGEEWKQWEKEKIVELRIAQSRKDPSNKVYVQHLLQNDVGWLQEHLFKSNGVIFLCGGQAMSDDVNQVFHNAIVAEVKMPYKAFTMKGDLKKNGTIVEEVFG